MIEALAALGSQVGNLWNTAASFAGNYINRRYADKSYDRQRQDALSDYQMQNAYNSPMQQMARLREAGVNPVMAFKTGAMEAAPVRSSNIQPWKAEIPQINPGSAIAAYQDAKVKQAQTDNLTQQNTLLKNQQAETSARTAAILAGIPKTEIETKTGKLQYDIAVQTALEKAILENKKLGGEIGQISATSQNIQANTAVLWRRDEREAAMTSSSLKEAAERILLMREQRAKSAIEREHIKQQIKNLKTDNYLHEEDLRLKKNGIQPSDNIGVRIVATYLDGLRGSSGAVPGGNKEGYINHLMKEREKRMNKKP